MEQKKNAPVEEMRIGRVKAKIWANETKNGSLYNVTFSRLYVVEADKDGETKSEWRETSSFPRDELLVLAKLANEVHSRPYEIPAEEE